MYGLDSYILWMHLSISYHTYLIIEKKSRFFLKALPYGAIYSNFWSRVGVRHVVTLQIGVKFTVLELDR